MIQIEPLPSVLGRPLAQDGLGYDPQFYNVILSAIMAIKELQARLSITSSALAPTASDIQNGDARLWKTGGAVKLYVNDGGVLKSITLT